MLGLYYATREKINGKGEGMFFADVAEVQRAWDSGVVELQTRCTVRIKEYELNKETGEAVEKIVRYETTVGRALLSEILPKGMSFKELNITLKKKEIAKLINRCFRKCGLRATVIFADKLKDNGYRLSTRAGISICVGDMKVPAQKEELIRAAEKEVKEIESQYTSGLVTQGERYNKVVDIWGRTSDQVGKVMMQELSTEPTIDRHGKKVRQESFNSVYMMADSGARGSAAQIRQLAGMRGLMAKPDGSIIETPITANFREGLNVLQYFISTHGARKGLADTALKTANSGYLTRRLVDVTQDLVVTEDDCGTTNGFEMRALVEGGEVIQALRDRVLGRVAAVDVKNPDTGEVVIEAGTLIDEDLCDLIDELGIDMIKVRTPLTCETRYGLCAKCYGRDLGRGSLVNAGESVGVIAAQSIGEPGTQLTMRTFHTGGIAATGDITQGLPRVEELFEVRRPKGCATLSEVSGIVSIDMSDNMKHVFIKDEATGEELKEYVLPFNAELKVKEGDKVQPGDLLNLGSLYPQDILRIKGVSGVQDYILEQVQSVYRSQGVDINDKHIEIIVRQMLKRVCVENAGDTDLLPGELVDLNAFQEESQKAIQAGKRPALAKRVLQGITKASLATDSFLSAASFQETSRVLTEAAIRTKRDYLVGLKENVIIGKLIPAGTGMKDYKQLSPQYVGSYAATQPTESEENAE